MNLKTALFFLSGLLCIDVIAQNIPNGTFENWTIKNSGLQPDNWTVYTPGIVRINMPDGGYGLQMQTLAGSVPSSIGCGFAYTQRPLNFRFLGGYKKGKSTDMAMFTVFLFKSTAGTRDTVAYNQFTWDEQTASGNTIQLNDMVFTILYSSGAIPDSCELRITHAVSSNATSIDDGTILVLDNIVFRDWATSAREVISTSPFISVFPNPANTNTTISIKLSQPDTVEMHLTDLNGRQVNEVVYYNLPQGESKIPLNTCHLPNGLYLLFTGSSTFCEVKKIQVCH
ncbi:MAG: T9SS type A sorting domain-containing protein [Bacteroidia bacterium]|nr:T9SS type A sorting domain-containing protein [Bacteroidia bacterium]